MKKFFSYFISVSFFKQLLAAAILLVILIQALSWGLRSYTGYNQTLTVPRLEGLSFDRAQDVLKKLNLKAVASDTLSFVKDQDPFVVLAKQPAAGEKVKIGRKIYLSLNDGDFATLPLPEVVQLTRRNAVSRLRALGFTVSDSVRYIDAIGKDMVYELDVGTRRVVAGDRLSIRDTLQLVLGNGKDTLR